MRNKFACFYDVKNDDEIKAIWEDQNTLFIFDTNVLLSLYAFKFESRDDFFKVLSKMESRIWIPFHVCLEFQLNRITVIKNRRNSFSKLKKGIGDLHDVLKLDKRPFTTLQTEFSLQKKYPEVHQNLTKLQEDMAAGVKELNEKLKLSIQTLNQDVDKIDTEKLFVNSDDFIRKEIGKYFNDERVGDNNFKIQDELDDFNNKGTERYENSIPPGYEDAKLKGEEEFFFDGLRYKRKFGDLIIFKQIIEHVKEKKQKNIIFISEDVKEDWRQIEDFDGKKILGARVELKREIYNEAGVKNFLIFNIEDFMKKTNEYLNVEIKSDTLSSIKESLAKEAEALKFERQKLEKLKRDRFEKIQLESSMKKEMEEFLSAESEVFQDTHEKYKELTDSNNDFRKYAGNSEYEISDTPKSLNYFSDLFKVDNNIERRANSYIRRLTKNIYMNFPENIIKELKKYRRAIDSSLLNYENEKTQLNLNMLELECERASDYLKNLKYFI
ncbi:Uncharacterised protein [Providencia rustigianii]|uniref:PIN like domain-containing protein n=1 Tax=Providencia rustigianii TaxID=158850 RepID=A0A379G3T1_9GAMM|nr:PIN-like domain-containing protein [Providencia rustigianii]SUC35263.1 Uncharacterised protein [Providencia rustigianii]